MTDAFLSVLGRISDERETMAKRYPLTGIEAMPPFSPKRVAILLATLGYVSSTLLYEPERLSEDAMHSLQGWLIGLAAQAYAWADNLEDVDLETGQMVLPSERNDG